MKGFKIPTCKGIEARKKAGTKKKQKKMPYTSVADHSTGKAVAPSCSTESSMKRAKVEEGDDTVLQLPQSASS